MNKQAINSAAFEKNILNLLKKNKFSGYRTHHGVGGAGLGGLVGAGAGAIDAYTDSDNEDLSSQEKMQKYLNKMLTYGGAGAAVGGGLGALKGRKIRNALAKKEMDKLTPALRQELAHANSLDTPHAREAGREAIKAKVHEAVPAVSPEDYHASGRDIFKENKQQKAEERDALRQQKQQQRAAERETARKAEAEKGTFVDDKYVSPDASSSRTFKSKVREGVQGARDMVSHAKDFVTGEGKVKAQAAANKAKTEGYAKEWESRGVGGGDIYDRPSYERAGLDMTEALRGATPKIEKDQLSVAMENAKNELKKHQDLLAKNPLDLSHRENVTKATTELKGLKEEATRYSNYKATGDTKYLQPKETASAPVGNTSNIPLEKELFQAHDELQTLNNAAMQNPGNKDIIGQREEALNKFNVLHSAYSENINRTLAAHKALVPRPVRQPKVKSTTSPATTRAPEPKQQVDPGIQAQADYWAGKGRPAPKPGGPPVSVTVPSGPVGMTNLGDAMQALGITPQSLI